MADRIYRVSWPDGTYRLVLAANRSRAINHVASQLFDVKVATTSDVKAGLEDGVEVEHPGFQDMINSGESPGN